MSARTAHGQGANVRHGNASSGATKFMRSIWPIYKATIEKLNAGHGEARLGRARRGETKQGEELKR